MFIWFILLGGIKFIVRKFILGFQGFFFFKNYVSDVLIVSDEVCYFCEK